MPYQVMSGWAKWSAGAVITGGEITEYMAGAVGKVSGFDPVTKAQAKKLGLTFNKIGTPKERIAELIARGVLHGIGEDAVRQPDTPVILQPTYEERQAVLRDFNAHPELT